MSIETKIGYWVDNAGKYECERAERFLRLVQVTCDPVVLIYDDQDRLLYHFGPEQKTEAAAVARAIAQALSDDRM